MATYMAIFVCFSPTKLLHSRQLGAIEALKSRIHGLGYKGDLNKDFAKWGGGWKGENKKARIHLFGEADSLELTS